jgi:hypothetical protein
LKRNVSKNDSNPQSTIKHPFSTKIFLFDLPKFQARFQAGHFSTVFDGRQQWTPLMIPAGIFDGESPKLAQN